MLLKVESNTTGVFTYLSRAIGLLWPPTTPAAAAAGARMAQAGWVPTYPAAAEGAAAETSAAAGQAAAPPATAHAQAMASDLAAFCPSVSLAQLERWARTLRLFAACTIAESPLPRQALLVAHQHLLLDCQALLDSLVRGSNPSVAMWGSQLVLLSGGWQGMSAERYAALDALFEAALDAAEREKREQWGGLAHGGEGQGEARRHTPRGCLDHTSPPLHLAAGWLIVVQGSLQAASWCIDYAAMLQNPAPPPDRRPQLRRAAPELVARLRGLARRAQRALAALRAGRWVPRAQRQDMEDSLGQLEHDLGTLARGGALTGGC
jgi:hypothetical protein